MTINIAQQDFVSGAVVASGAILLAANAVAMDHPDAGIIALVAEYEQVILAREAHAPTLDEARARYLEPTLPAALLPKASDPRSFRPCKTHDGVQWYANLVADFRKSPVMRSATTDDGERISIPYPAGQARADEIVKAYDAWQEASRQAKEASGYAAADLADDQMYERMWELHEKIAAARPATVEGVKAKARASQLRRKIVVSDNECDSDVELLLSITDDLVRLDAL